ncbi:hypothetical protein SKAU_G00328590 [Synaphobranchus kaupii]|uniref:Uncharacterized protein n=1 Tax=Synaphobranchus kaupii TaxID=118154 RepID=A0A9Q1IKH8_SYNKA|nr:hypothetical protein SKAU_G00328590 [Synaphobranchus kaupii]
MKHFVLGKRVSVPAVAAGGEQRGIVWSAPAHFHHNGTLGYSHGELAHFLPYERCSATGLFIYSLKMLSDGMSMA